jgi:hypothetical protein
MKSAVSQSFVLTCRQGDSAAVARNLKVGDVRQMADVGCGLDDELVPFAVAALEGGTLVMALRVFGVTVVPRDTDELVVLRRAAAWRRRWERHGSTDKRREAHGPLYPYRSLLTEHDILRDAVAVVPLSSSSHLHKNLDSLLERTMTARGLRYQYDLCRHDLCHVGR